MYQIKINEESYAVPTELAEVTIANFLALREIDIHNTLEVLYWGIGSKPHFKETDTVEKEIGVAFGLIVSLIEEIYNFTESKLKHVVPDSVKVLGVTVQLRKGLLQDLPYWPYVVAKHILAEELKKKPFDPTSRYPEILAHYLYAAVTRREYDEKKATYFVEAINDIPFTAVLQLGNFFLMKHKELPFSKRKRSLLSKMK